MAMAAGAGPRRGGAEPSESSPEPPSPSSSRPPRSDTSPTPSDEATPPPRRHAPPRGGAGPRHAPAPSAPPCDRTLALFEEELATRPRVPALLRRMAPYSALSPDSDDGRAPGRALGALWGVAAPSLQTLLGLVLVLRLPWVVGTGGVLQAGAIGLLLGACAVLTAVSLSAIATNGLDPGGCPLGLLSGALGPEAGGAVGLCAFLSAAFAAAAAALGAAEILLVYVAPQAAVLPGRGRGARLNNGRGYGAGLLALLGLGAAARHAARVTPLGPAGLLLALLGLQAGALRAALPGGNAHTLCLPPQPGGRLQPCPTARPHGGGDSNGTPGARPAIPGPSARLLAQNLWPRPPEPGLREGPGGAEVEDDDDSSFGVLLGLSLPTTSGVLWGCSRCGELRDVARSVPAGSLGAALATALGCIRPARGTPVPGGAPNLGGTPQNVGGQPETSIAFKAGECLEGRGLGWGGRPGGGVLLHFGVGLPVFGGGFLDSADLSAALLLGASVEGQLLRDKFGGSLRGTPVAGAASWPSPWVPLAGALLSAGGAGLQALLGGSRLLRGLARTRALPLPHALGRGRLWPLAATAAVAELGVLLGSLDLLAPVLSVFWLTAYLGVNLACALQGLLPTPGWSPRCRLYHWGVSLAGAGLCLGLMLVTCWYCALLALGIGATAYKYLEYRGAQSEWGEGLRGLSLSAARFALLRLEDGQPPAPSWRPQLLVLLKLDEELRATQPQVLALAAQLQAGKGLTVVGSVIPGELPQDLPRARAAERALRAGLAGAGARGFVQVLVAPARGPGLAALVQGCGLGALRPNTVLLGWPHGWRRRHDPAAARRFVGETWGDAGAWGRGRRRGDTGGRSGGRRGDTQGPGAPRGGSAPPEPPLVPPELLRVAGAGGRALLVAKGPLGAGAPGGTLDVWWVVGDGRLLTLLPLLLRQHPAWRGCRVRLFTVALLEDNSVRLRRLLEAVARRRGLPAQTHVVELHDGDVSAYTYERTLMMEQRSQMLRQMRQAQGGPAPSQAPSAAEEEEEEGGTPRRGPSPVNVRRMHAAERLNEAVGAHSGGARLVLLDLPPPPPPRPPRPLDNYLEFLEVLTEGLGPVLLVRGGDGDAPDP
ncbi:solute carrier family 12 member 4-like [Phalacrocorax carbo]|uniref:solute carrier family 12 member 4-like n=1 Tax=Phalacrocorax carbo TaxID=9209 RepID=UPI00311A2C28